LQTGLATLIHLGGTLQQNLSELRSLSFFLFLASACKQVCSFVGKEKTAANFAAVLL